MTANQVAYWQLQESKRHNAVTEDTEKGKLNAQAQRWQDQSRIETGKLGVERGQLSVDKRKADILAQEAYNHKMANEINVANVISNAIGNVAKAASMFV